MLRPDRFSRLGAVRLLQVQILLLTLLPSRLVFGPLKGVGSPALLFGIGLLVVWFLSVLMPGGGVARVSWPTRLALLGFWVVVLISYAVANSHPIVPAELANSDRYLIQLAAFSGISLTAAEGLRDRKEIYAVLRTAVIGIGFMAFVAVLQFRPGINLANLLEHIPFLTPNGELVSIQNRGGFNRPSGTALHPIELGVIVGSVLPVAIHLLVYDRQRDWRYRYLPLAFIAAAIPVSVSRSALLTAAVSMLYFFIGATRALRRRALLLLVGGVAATFMFIPGMLGTLRTLVVSGNSDSSISSRTSDYAAVASYITSSPLIGRGPGTFLPSYRLLDNEYLLSLVEIGILGAVAFAVLFGLPAFLGPVARRRSRSEEDKSLSQALTGLGVAGLLASATFDALSFPTFTLLSAFWIGLTAAWWSLAPEGEPRSQMTESDAIRPAEGTAAAHPRGVAP